MRVRSIIFLSTILVLGTISWKVFFNEEEVDYSTEVKPILNKHCISCHGGVKKQGGFSLLFHSEALAKTKSGKPAIVPFHPEQSDFIARLTHQDAEERMPYKKEPLSDKEIEVLTKWVKQGAKWGEHWAYVALEKEKVPGKSVFSSLFGFGAEKENDIDYFVKDKLKEAGLSMSDEADKEVLVRRVYLDLIGLPPTPAQRRLHMEDDSDEWYEKMVDGLLKNPAFGERWASMWLDLARYADSRGYQKDNARNIWQYRDWVIKAYNNNMPFDQFTTEQLAGDLLPEPDKNNYVATGFHRNTMNNDETGTVDEEFRVASVIDRVNTTWDVWQGTTFSCVQCHSHPYDPFKHEDYYKSMAFFNNQRDEDTQDEAPFYREFEKEDEVRLISFIKSLPPDSKHKKDLSFFLRTLEPRHHAHYADQYVNGALLGDRNIGLRNNGSCRLPAMELTGKSDLLMNFRNPNPGGKLEIRKGSLTGEVIASVSLDTMSQNKLYIIPIKETTGKHDLYLLASNARLKPNQDVFTANWFVFLDKLPFREDPVMMKEFFSLISVRTKNTPIMLENHRDYQRNTHVFERGNWLVHGKKVEPGVPASLNAYTKDYPKNRLGLAKWLVDKNNPLTSRVIVNRYWEQLFGRGIVETLEDFGSQGSKPVHQHLLDYLSVKYREEMGWRPKDMLKYIVMSATYRQSSVISDEAQEKDPLNYYYSHAPQVRLSSEMIRDQALVVSNLLNPEMYGKPVLPYQPEGVWQAVNSSLNYKQSEGKENYRRAIYTFVRRTGPYPQQLTFDAPSREVCTQRRIRTNTPLQALQLLNDPVFMEASKAMGAWMLKSGKKTDDRIRLGYKKIFLKDIKKEDLAALTALYNKAGSRTQKDKELFGMTIVANTMMNLDEFVTKK
jgi:hypothetical protein